MILWAVASFCAYFVKGLCGFANTLVFTSILGFGASNALISPVELLLGFPSNLIVTWRERRAVQWRVVLPLCALVLLGSVPGVFILRHTDARTVKIAFGVVLVAVGAEMLYRQISNRPGKDSKIALAGIGVLSGVLCGLYGVGVLLAAYVGRVAKDAHAFRGSLCAVFAVENVFRIVLYAVTGILTADALARTAMLLPVMLLGLFAGMKSANYVSERLARILVLALLIVSGAALALTNL